MGTISARATCRLNVHWLSNNSCCIGYKQQLLLHADDWMKSDSTKAVLLTQSAIHVFMEKFL